MKREQPKVSRTGAQVRRTPGPWKVETFGRYLRITEATHEDDNNDVLLSGDCENEQVRANLEFIVKACNAHDDLLTAALNTLSYYDSTQPGRVCLADELNPCGGLQHWGGGAACPLCSARAALRQGDAMIISEMKAQPAVRYVAGSCAQCSGQVYESLFLLDDAYNVWMGKCPHCGALNYLSVNHGLRGYSSTAMHLVLPTDEEVAANNLPAGTPTQGSKGPATNHGSPLGELMHQLREDAA